MPSQKNKKISPLLILKKKGTGILSGSNSIRKNKKQFRTAQLHNKTQYNPLYSGDGRTPVREGMLHLLSLLKRIRNPAASLTVEAAVALPLFIAAMCLLMYPMRVMNAQLEAQVCMEKAGETISTAEAVKTSISTTLQKEKDKASDLKKAAAGGTEENSAENTRIAGTSIDEVFHFVETIGSGAAIFVEFDTDVIGFPIITKLKMPDHEDPYTEINVSCLAEYPLSGLLGGHYTAGRLVSKRRAWIGREGGAGRSYATDDTSVTEEGTEEPDDSQTTVYVARNSVNSGRYHTNAGCHYISNVMTAVSASSIDSLRSTGGGKYHACPSCKPGNAGTVYIFRSGDAYHASKECKSIQSYAVEITLKEAKERGLTQCTYCSRSH